MTLTANLIFFILACLCFLVLGLMGFNWIFDPAHTLGFLGFGLLFFVLFHGTYGRYSGNRDRP